MAIRSSVLASSSRARSGGAGVAGRQRDLGQDREHAGPPERVGLARHAADGDLHRLLVPPLGEAQERQPAAGSAADLLEPGEGLLGRLEVAEAAADVADLGERGGAVGHVAAAQLVAGPRRLLLGLLEGAAAA